MGAAAYLKLAGFAGSAWMWLRTEVDLDVGGNREPISIFFESWQEGVSEGMK
jgi:hypothetical protein